jgi:hypothetical protein
MGKLLKRRIGATHQLQDELDKRVHRTQDLITSVTAIPVDGSGAPSDANLDDSYISANEFARTYHQDLIEYTDIVNDTTSGGANVPASAEAVKSLQLQIDGMANGLEYIGTFDPSGGAWPSNVTQGNFFKVSGSGTIDGVELNTGDMIIANKIVSGASAVSDWDIVDNTEAADILRDADVIDDDDMTVEPLKIPTRQSVGNAIADATAAITIKVQVDTVTISGNQMTLTHSPVSGVVMMDEAIIEVDSANGVYDTWEGVSITNGNTATLSGASTVQYDGLSAKVTYLYI